MHPLTSSFFRVDLPRTVCRSECLNVEKKAPFVNICEISFLFGIENSTLWRPSRKKSWAFVTCLQLYCPLHVTDKKFIRTELPRRWSSARFWFYISDNVILAYESIIHILRTWRSFCRSGYWKNHKICVCLNAEFRRRFTVISDKYKIVVCDGNRNRSNKGNEWKCVQPGIGPGSSGYRPVV